MDDRKRLEFAAEVFLAEMRRQCLKLYPNSQVTFASLEGYPESQRSAIIASVNKAVGAMSPASDAFYQGWLERKRQ